MAVTNGCAPCADGDHADDGSGADCTCCGALTPAGLGVGHIWTAVSCPAYRTLDGADCTCGGDSQ